MSRPPLMIGDELQPVIRLARRAARYWRIGLIALGVATMTSLATAVLRPNKYRSEAVVYYREGIQWAPNEGMSARRIGQRLKDMLLARAQLAKVIEELGIYPKLVKAGGMAEAVEEMRLATGFRLTEGDVFVISFTGSTPAEAQRVTAKLTEVLIGENTRFRSEQARVATAFLESEKKRNEAELNAKEAEQLRFLARHPEFAHEQAAAGGVTRARTRRDPEAAAASDRDSEALGALRREEERLRRQLNAPGQAPRTPQDPTLVTAKEEAEAKLRGAQRELADRRAHFTEQHPDVRSAEAMFKAANEAYRRAAEALDAAEPAVLKERLTQVQQDIADYRRRRAREMAPGDPIPSPESAQRIVAAESEWARLTREASDARERFQQLDSKQFMSSMTASILMSGQGAQIVVIDPAFLPAEPVGFSRARWFALGFLISCALGAATMLVFATLDDRIYDGVDVERLGLGPVLVETTRGDLPAHGAQGGAPSKGPRGREAPEPSAAAARDPARSPRAESSDSSELVRVDRLAPPASVDPRLFMLGPPDCPAAAAFRVLRQRLLVRGTKTILVTSSRAEEVTTECAVNLALAFGEAGRGNVLLLEANFRRPSVARLLGFDPPLCIGEQLVRHRTNPTQPWAVAENVTPWLHTAAVAPGSEVRPVLDAALQLFMTDFRQAGYGYIVIASPPILGAADANLMEESVDGVLVTVRRGKSRARVLRKAVEQIGSSKLLGFALMEG